MQIILSVTADANTFSDKHGSWVFFFSSYLVYSFCFY